MATLSRREFVRGLGAGAAALAFPSLGLARQGSRPNFLFLFTDDQTFQSIQALNNPEVATPNLDRLVRAGTTFSHAFIQGSFSGAVCIASRATLITGRHLWHCGGGSCADHPLWPETFRRAGYDTFETGKWHNGPKTFARSFTHGGNIFFGGMHSPKRGGHWRPSVCDFDPTGKYPRKGRHVVEQHSSELFADAAVSFLQKRAGRDGRPFFMYVSFTAPHDPRQAPKAFTDRYAPGQVRVPPNFLPEHPFDQGDHRIRDEMLAPFPRTPEVVQEHRAAYYAMITHVDSQIGRILDTLEQSGRAKNTIVIFSADNGLAVGQHGLMGKQSMYDHSLRVPLVVSGPGIPRARTIDALVYLPSLFATTCELAGLRTPESVQLPSLAPLTDGRAAEVHESVYAAYKGYQRMVRTTRHKLIYYPRAGRTQLFDMQADPWETTNLAEAPEHAGLIRELDAKLEAWRKTTGDTLDVREAMRSPHPGDPVRADAAGAIALEPATAITHGHLCYQPDRANLGCWTRAADFPEWRLADVKPGEYEVEFAYGSTNPGVAFTIAAGESKLAGATEHTGGIKTYRAFAIGRLRLPAGAVTLRIQPGPFKGAIMNFRRLTLRPTAE